MTNNAVHQSLIELEENLKEVASARKQVQSVASDTERLVTTINKLVKDFEKLRIQYADANKSVSSVVSQSVGEFTSSLQQQTAIFQKSVSQTLSQSNEVVSQFMVDVNLLESRLETAVDSAGNMLGQRLDKGASDLLDQSRQLFERSRKSLDSLSDGIKSLDSSLTSLKERIDNTDFSRALDAFHGQLMAVSSNVAELLVESRSRNELVLNQLRKQAKDAEMRFKVVMVGLMVVALLGVVKFFV